MYKYILNLKIKLDFTNISCLDIKWFN